MKLIKKWTKIFSAMALMLAIASSCVTPKEVNYLSDMTSQHPIPLNNNFEAVINPYDQLRITVLGLGEEKESAEPFNPYGTPQNMANQQNNLGYLVDVKGNIQFPALGELHVKGLTRLQLQDTIAQRLISGGYMSEPMVDVRFTNFRVFILGTADGGKVLTINNERCTFLEALAMAGGIDKYTRRDHIAVIREIDGKMVTRYLDPRSSEVFNDPFFLLQQNDIIVTRSFRRTYALDWFNTSLPLISTIASLVTTATLVITIFSGQK